MRFPVVSARAVVPEGCLVAVLPTAGVAQVDLWLPFPRGACPVSGNPILGAVHVSYQPRDAVVELVSTHRLVQRAGRSPTTDAQSVEGAARWLHDELERAVGVPVIVELWLLVRPGPQLYRVRCG